MHINEFPGAGESSAYLAKYDSVHGQWPHACAFEDGHVVVDGAHKISYSTHAAPYLVSSAPPSPPQGECWTRASSASSSDTYGV